MTPGRVFQVLITEPGSAAVSTASLRRNIASLKLTYPHAQYRRYGDEELLDFISENHAPAVLAAYRAMAPYSYKSDLARYCLLYTYGGLYSDLSYLHLRAIDVDDRCEMVVFRDIPGHPSWATSTAVIYSKPNNPVLKRAIDQIVANHKAGYYGCSSLDPTGPYLFGRVLAETQDWTNIKFGDSQLLNTDQTGRPNIVKIMPTGEVVAIRNKTKNGTIEDLISEGGNDYNKLWVERRIWG